MLFLLSDVCLLLQFLLLLSDGELVFLLTLTLSIVNQTFKILINATIKTPTEKSTIKAWKILLLDIVASGELFDECSSNIWMPSSI